MRRVDWTGWLKGKWNRSRRSLGQRPLFVVAADALPRVSHHDVGCAVEFLERRELLAAVTWDGGGDGTHWNDALNWSNDVLPTSADDVTINFGTNTIIHDSATDTINSLTTTNAFTLATSELAVVTTVSAGSPCPTSAAHPTCEFADRIARKWAPSLSA